jgi:hypothetical protein
VGLFHVWVLFRVYTLELYMQTDRRSLVVTCMVHELENGGVKEEKYSGVIQ